MACLKDLRRWLKLYDTKLNRLDVKRCLSEANLVKGDLLEILGQWRDQDHTNVLRRKVALGSLELLTELTWPITIDVERTTVNHLRHLPTIQLAQVEYKRAILHHESGSIFRKAISAAIPALSTPKRERTAREEGIINLVLYLFRNIIMINQPTDLPANGDEEDISRSETINALYTQDVLQLVLTICSSMGDDFAEQDIIVLELLFSLLKGIDPKRLFKGHQQRKTDDLSELRKLRLQEKSMLATAAKNAPTRHTRFGTMVWVKQADDKVMTMTGQDMIGKKEKTFEKMDSTKTWNRPKPRMRNAMHEGTEFAPVRLDSRAEEQLRSFVSDFLDSSFNPLFDHLRRALEREVERIKPETHHRQYFYLISWFLKADESRREAEGINKSNPLNTSVPLTTDTPFAYVAAVLTQENFVLLNRTMQRSLDDKTWSTVHPCLLAFTQIMLSVWAMSESPSEDDQEIAENIQSRFFYEEATHDRILLVLRGYQEGRQDFAYLDACTDLAHVFLRLLERYSKVNVDMFIRSKRRARKKASAKPKGAATVEGLEDEQPQNVDDGAQDEADAHREVRERKFDFTRFALKFVTEPAINTFLALLSRYRDLNEDQLKRCHRFFYRVAFKMEVPILLYRVETLNLFNKMAQGPGGLDSILDKRSLQFKEWDELIKQIFRRCIRKLEERPELIVEMLFTKIPSTMFYLEHGHDKPTTTSTPRAPAELVVQPGMDHAQEIGVAVGILVDQGKLDDLNWVKNSLSSAIEERRSWEELNTALRERATTTQDASIFGGATHADQPVQTENTGGTSSDVPAENVDQPASETEALAAPAIRIVTDSPERKKATFKDKHLRLLLKTLGFRRDGDVLDPEADWVVPGLLSANTLEEDLDSIRKFEFDPPVYDNGKSAESFVQSAAVAARRNAYEKEASDEDGDSDLDEGLFVPGGPTRRPDDPRENKPKRKRRLQRRGEDITDEQREERAAARRQKEKEKDAKIKSTLFVTESDDEDDNERDEAFFRLETERRGNEANAIKAALMDGRTGHGEERASKRKSGTTQSKAKKRRRTMAGSDSDEASMNGSDDEDVISRESTPASADSSDSDRDDEERHSAQDGETPLSSQTLLGQDDGPKTIATVEEVDEDEDLPVKTARRTTRQLFVIDDDDSD